jgi:hypothetical protein
VHVSLFQALAVLCALVGLTTVTSGQDIRPSLINGKPVASTKHPEVVLIDIVSSKGSRLASCTGTVVGPRVVATAAHCILTGQRARFTYKGVQYTGRGFQSPLYATDELDLAVVIADKDLKNVTPVRIEFNPLTSGETILLAGYGCTTKSGTGGNDGTLRTAEAKVVGGNSGSSDVQIDGGPYGGTACMGDSGGPTLRKQSNGAILLAGIISQSDLDRLTFSVRLDLRESKEFFEEAEDQYNVEICGLSAGGC